MVSADCDSSDRKIGNGRPVFIIYGKIGHPSSNRSERAKPLNLHALRHDDAIYYG
jgi:hypothetical protein